MSGHLHRRFWGGGQTYQRLQHHHKAAPDERGTCSTADNDGCVRGFTLIKWMSVPLAGLTHGGEVTSSAEVAVARTYNFFDLHDDRARARCSIQHDQLVPGMREWQKNANTKAGMAWRSQKPCCACSGTCMRQSRRQR